MSDILSEPPVGVIVHDNEPCKTERDGVQGIISKFSSLTPQQVKIAEKFSFRHETCIEALQARQEVLERCVELEKEFRVVTLDASAKRRIKYKQGGEDRSIEVPLIWSTRLPASPMTEIEPSYNIKCAAVTPHPTPEAMRAMKEHGHKFDWMELWWVPKHVEVSQRPSRPAPADPDPILVGCIEPTEGDSRYYFELHRWVDELVEEGWWSQEAY